MNRYILFSPWKSGSSEFNRQIEIRGKFVFKEILHEDRFESKTRESVIDDEWSEFRKTNIGYIKYNRPDKLNERERAYCLLLAEDLSKFLDTQSHEKTIVLQFSESISICQELHANFKKICDINAHPKL